MTRRRSSRRGAPTRRRPSWGRSGRTIGEVRVEVTAPGVDAAVLVIEVDSAGDCLGQGEAGGGGPVTGELVPLLLGDVLSHQEWGGDRGGRVVSCVDISASSATCVAKINTV